MPIDWIKRIASSSRAIPRGSVAISSSRSSKTFVMPILPSRAESKAPDGPAPHITTPVVSQAALPPFCISIDSNWRYAVGRLDLLRKASAVLWTNADYYTPQSGSDVVLWFSKDLCLLSFDAAQACDSYTNMDPKSRRNDSAASHGANVKKCIGLKNACPLSLCRQQRSSMLPCTL